MSKDQKRFRQLNIFQSFENCKKPRTDRKTSDMDPRLREMVATAAEKRLSASQNEASTSASEKINKKLIFRDTLEAGKSSKTTRAKNYIANNEIPPTPDIRSNLHDLLEATEKSEMQMKTNKVAPVQCSSKDYDACLAFKVDRRKVQIDTEDEIAESSEDLFPDSADLFEDVEEFASQRSTDSLKISALTCSAESQEIFIEEEDIETDTVDASDENSEEDDEISLLKRKPDCSLPLPKLEPLQNHSIMFSPHIRPGDAPRPYPSSYRDRWDYDHVRMPCSPQNRYPVEDVNGEKQIWSRWDLIKQSLQRNIDTPQQLEEAIMSYNSQYRGRWNFYSFHAFFDTCFQDYEREQFFEVILPTMIHMALDLPNICTQAIPLMKKNKDHYVTMTQKQVGCLLLNAFFCMFPRRNFISRHTKFKSNSEYSTYPDINFNRLYYGSKNRISPIVMEKLKCIINYFRRIVTHEPTGVITFHRQFLKNVPVWDQSTRGLQSVVIESKGLIESEGHGMLQVDFANKFVGGGVLGHGCVQEEIRFLICPELIIARLFVECLGPHEVLIVTGVEQYSKYSGYSDTFKWEGNFNDHSPRDAWGRRVTEVVAMDATHFTKVSEQFESYFIQKELRKAFCGFFEDAPSSNLSAVATGNWGCGAFNGNPTFKFLIQFIAASQAKRDLLYFTFGNKALKKELRSIYAWIVAKNLSVGDLFRIVKNYSRIVRMKGKEPYPKMFEFLCDNFTSENTFGRAEASQEVPEITASDEIALRLLVEEVQNEGSDTDIEDNNKLIEE